MKILSFFFLLLFSISTSPSQTPDDASEQARAILATADGELNSFYQQIMEMFKSDKTFIENLKASQRSWIHFRDAQVKMKYPNYVPNSKKITDERIALYLARLTGDRLGELQNVINNESVKYSNFIGIWRGGNNSIAKLKITKIEGDIYQLELIHPDVHWVGVGYRKDNTLFASFRYTSEDSHGFLTLTMQNINKITYSCINTDGSFRVSGYTNDNCLDPFCRKPDQSFYRHTIPVIMTIPKLIFFCLFLYSLYDLTVIAQPRTQFEVNIIVKYKEAEEKIQEVYRQVLISHIRDTLFLKNLKIAQALWYQYRDAQINVRFPKRNRLENDSSNMLYIYAYKRQLIEARIKELQVYLENVIAPQTVERPTRPLEWLSFPDAVAKAKTSGKKVLVVFRSAKNAIDVDLKEKFSTDGKIYNYLSDHFFLVTIDQSHTEYRNQQLQDLLSQKIAGVGGDPAIVYFDENGDKIWYYRGGAGEEMLYRSLVYTAEDLFLKQSFADYGDDIKRASQNKKSVQWYSYNEGIKIAEQTGKKIMINAHAFWSPYCIKMKGNTYSNSAIIEYIESNFVPIQIEVQIPETPRFMHKGNKIHSYDLEKFYGVTGYPNTVFCENNGTKIDLISGNIAPDVFLYVLKYFKEERYKWETMDTYLKLNGIQDGLKK